ncbi:MAG: Gfo/Idh/MocA family oxidoreductase [Opitutaceae bacterium]|nr:Gfo/Idh/MocA family oxidoreductase [Opitutaceae bacterium]
MQADQIGFGIVGTGMIAGFHAQAIAAVPGARLVGAASRSDANVRAFAARHGIPFATTRLDELLARPDLHVVCITTPSGAHLEPALAAIAARRHVVIEKPLEITPARADRIITAAEAAGVRLVPIFQARFGPGARTVKAALERGRFGRLVLASAYVKWHRAPSYYTGWKGRLDLDGGGAVINQAIHGLDLLQWFAGLPAEISAWKTRRVHTGIEGEDTACAALRFPDGALGTFEATTAAWPGWSRRIELCGEHGSVSLEDDRIARWDFAAPEPGDDALRAAPRDPAPGSGASAPNAISYAGHQRQIEDLVEALRTGRPTALDGREGRKAVALVHALYTAAESGRTVTVPEA